MRGCLLGGVGRLLGLLLLVYVSFAGNDIPHFPVEPFVGTFKNEKLTVKVVRNEQLPGQVYQGTITLGDNTYNFDAGAKGEYLVGSFTTKDKNVFEFTAVIKDKNLVLTTGKSTYTLAPQAVVKNPLDDPAPGPNNPLENPTPAPGPVAPSARNAGVGMHITISGDGGIFVSELLPGGPADRGGVQKGDQLVGIDDKPVRGIEDLSANLPGTAGSAVKLKFLRLKDTIVVSLKREVIAPPSPAPTPGPGPGPNPVPAPNPRVEGRDKSGGDFKLNADNMQFTLFPELKTAPAPAWVKPGLRISYYSASASIPGARVGGFTQDPDGKYRDPTTGKTYSLDDAASASGHGFSQIDVVSLHDDEVAISLRLFTLDATTGQVHAALSAGYVTPPGAVSDVWVNPDVLKKHLDINGPGIRASRTQYKAMDKTFDAVWIGVNSDSGSTSTVTDLEGGLSLHSGTATCTASSTTLVNGVSTNVGGMTNLGQTTFVGVRQIKVPWAGAAMPDVLKNLKKLSYDGTYNVNIAGSAMNCRYRSDATITGRGSDFLQVHRTTRLDYGNGMAPLDGADDIVVGTNQLMPLAIPPEHLARLKQGQELDRDPVTKIVTSVVFAGRDRSGNDIVVISESAGENTQRADAIYDRNSGLQTGVVINDPATFSQMQLFLKGRE